jgi:hypothetical protein
MTKIRAKVISKNTFTNRIDTGRSWVNGLEHRNVLGEERLIV